MGIFFSKFVIATTYVYDLLRIGIVVVVVLVLLHVFVVTLKVVQGDSMQPSLHGNDVIVVNKLFHYVGTPERGDVVVIRFPGDPEKTRYVKRVIGLPGEQVELRQNRVLVNGKLLDEWYATHVSSELADSGAGQWQLGSNQYFLLGDNRQTSSDSRVFGPVEQRFFIGSVFAVLYPFNRAEVVPPVFY